MNKKDFIQRCAIRALPTAENICGFFSHSEWLWEQLSKAGYGSAKQQKTRENKDWYNELSDRQRQWLDKFRDAFGLKYSPRNRTALSWDKLGDKTDDEYKKIIAAARAESTLRLTRDTTPPYAELWLNEGRYTDFVASERRQGDADLLQRKRQLQGDLNQLLMFQMRVPADADQHESRIKQIRAELASLQ